MAPNFMRCAFASAVVVVIAGAFAPAASAQGSDLPPACTLVSAANVSSAFKAEFQDGVEGFTSEECQYSLGSDSAGLVSVVVATPSTAGDNSKGELLEPRKASQRAKFCKRIFGKAVKGLGVGACFRETNGADLQLVGYKKVSGSKAENLVSILAQEYDKTHTTTKVKFATKAEMIAFAKTILAKL
jgi:hypothetical protein